MPKGGFGISAPILVLREVWERGMIRPDVEEQSIARAANKLLVVWHVTRVSRPSGSAAAPAAPVAERIGSIELLVRTVHDAGVALVRFLQSEALQELNAERKAPEIKTKQQKKRRCNSHLT